MANEDPIEMNANVLQRELEWFSQVLQERLKIYFQGEGEHQSIYEIPVPEYPDDESIYASILRHYQMTAAERLVLLLALTPYIKPQLLDIFFTRNSTNNRRFTEFGGIAKSDGGGFKPTIETALFLLGENKLSIRFRLMSIFDRDHFFYRQNILQFATSAEESLLESRLDVSKAFLNRFIYGKEYEPSFSTNFPVKKLETELGWQDLVLTRNSLQELQSIQTWIEQGDMIREEWGLKKNVKAGYSAFFYGAPGTGKSLTSAVLGKHIGRSVYAIDLSALATKYIGETEKNLVKLFKQADQYQWILFFDEADALFGKRGDVKEVQHSNVHPILADLFYLMAEFPGVAILSSNSEMKVDAVFARRFQSTVHFPMPDAEQRLRLWQNAFSGGLELAEEVDLEIIAQNYELTGGTINNVFQFCALMAAKRNQNTVSLRDIEQGIRRELIKAGKVI